MLTNEILYYGIPYTATIKYHRMIYDRHCWGSKNELASDLLLWYPNHGKRSIGRHVKTYVDQLSTDTGCEREELEMQCRDEWGERVMIYRPSST